MIQNLAINYIIVYYCDPSSQHSDAAVFNLFLRELKSGFVGTRYAPFWSRVMCEGVTLVSSEECGGSSVTPEQAKQVSPVSANNLLAYRSHFLYAIIII